ncbi:glycoside hydrolase family 5 protein [Nocardiopsis halophila]|uniref:glycoside hydrolase family 5 protein n=1 Tax=Nocardiopsis halophila TaxID=141692 RepID=UPI00034D10BA|nr:glycoside hydrolase family 5 protein [Nocardiopsis halophila]
MRSSCHPRIPRRPRPRTARAVLALAAAASLAAVAACAPAAHGAPASGTAPAAGDGPAPVQSAGPADDYGALSVCGTTLCGEDGEPVQLKGMSSHGLQWFDQCLTGGSLDALAQDWGADVVRLSMYVQEGGYETDPEGFTEKVSSLIDEVTARGMYAIVDWHILNPGDPNANTEGAKEFFSEIAARHGGNGNVLYEIANEPNGVSWASIKGYAEEVVPVIRERDPDSVVLVGTRAWSSLGVSEGSDEQEILQDPVDAEQIMYTFHFYAGSHHEPYLSALDRASRELPIFVSEFGTQDYTGDGPNDFASAQRYIDLMEERGISWTNWNFSDDHRSGAAFEPGTCDAGGPWGGDTLKPAGAWVKDRIA